MAAHGYTDEDWCVIGEDQLLGDWEICPDLDEPNFDFACEPACERPIAAAPMRPGGLAHQASMAAQTPHTAPKDHLTSDVKNRRAQPMAKEISTVARLTKKAVNAARRAQGKRRSAIGDVAGGLIAAYLRRLSDGYDVAYVSSFKLSDSLGVARSTVTRHIAGLAAMGLHVHTDCAKGGRQQQREGESFRRGRACGRAVDMAAVEALIQEFLSHREWMLFVEAKQVFDLDPKCLTKELNETPIVYTNSEPKKLGSSVSTCWEPAALPTRPESDENFHPGPSGAREVEEENPDPQSLDGSRAMLPRFTKSESRRQPPKAERPECSPRSKEATLYAVAGCRKRGGDWGSKGEGVLVDKFVPIKNSETKKLLGQNEIRDSLSYTLSDHLNTRVRTKHENFLDSCLGWHCSARSRRHAQSRGRGYPQAERHHLSAQWDRRAGTRAEVWGLALRKGSHCTSGRTGQRQICTVRSNHDGWLWQNHCDLLRGRYRPRCGNGQFRSRLGFCEIFQGVCGSTGASQAGPFGRVARGVSNTMGLPRPALESSRAESPGGLSDQREHLPQRQDLSRPMVPLVQPDEGVRSPW